MNNDAEIRSRVLSVLYKQYFLSTDTYDLNCLLAEEAWDARRFENVVDRLEDEGLIKPMMMGGLYYELDVRGIMEAEESGIAPQGLKEANEKARTHMLVMLAEVFDEQGSLYGVANSELYQKTGLEHVQATANLLVLHDLYLAEPFANALTKITSRGLDVVDEYKERRSIADEFERLFELNPQPRGRALQKLIARLVEKSGWGQDEGVRTSNEEMDVILFREREYYLLESKWEKDPVEANVIRELFGKLENRIDVRGMVVSMSGFSDGAVKQVYDYIGKRVILLFGEQDVKYLIYQKIKFDELLNAKYKALITTKKVEFC
ncbi:MAG TPA: restriction endonuclease [Pyrinomonadaceae bacterium]|jgi:hypothetical protein